MGLKPPGDALTAAVTGGLLPTSVGVAAGRLRCLLWGRAGDPVAVLLHGNGGHAHWWDALVPALVPGWRLIAPDLRGHGESAWPEPPAYRIEDYANDLTAVLDALVAGPVVLVAHSMGGRVAAWYGARYPARVRGLALLDTRLEGVRPELAARWRARMAAEPRGRIYASREVAMAAFRFVPEEPGVAAAVIANLAFQAVHERAPGEWTFRFDRAVLSLGADEAGDLLTLVRQIRCPTWLAGGATSWVLDPAHRAAIRAAIPESTEEVFPGGHHFLLVHPEQVGRALRAFLDGLPPPASRR